MPDGKDPDDFIKQNGKESLLSLLKEKEIIQSFVWNFYLNKIDQTNPYEISKFEKEIKKLSYSIQDETLRKYVLEDFLEKINNLTPILTSRKNYSQFSARNKKDYKILKETKILHQKKKNLSKIQILEFSILFIILKYPEIASNKVEELSYIEFLSEKNELFKNIIIKRILEGRSKEELTSKIKEEFQTLLEEIKENSNIQIIIRNKNEQQILEIIDEMISEHKEQNNLKKIESLEKKLINNLDESSYSELVKLKSQLNRE